MSDDIDIINTPETLGVTPRFVLQHNAISRSIHNLSATAKRLTAMAMSLLPIDLSSRTAAFTFGEFCKALGCGDGGEQYRIFTAAVDECMKNVISIETGRVIKGKKAWEKYTWFSFAKFDPETSICTMTFSQELTAVLVEMKKVYAEINLQDLGKLQSRYALRIFEIAKSYESLKGKDGNKDGTWYFERDVLELRLLLGVPENAYPEIKRFRQKAIEEPVKEINAAGIGVSIGTTGIKQGQNLKKIRFGCTETARKLPVKRSRKKQELDTPLELPIPLKLTEQREDKELAHLKELYSEEFAAFYTDVINNPPTAFLRNNPRYLAGQADRLACQKLLERHGVVK